MKQWSEVSKNLTWKKQIYWFEFHTNSEFTTETEIAKKASSWFRVTYQWLYNQLKQNENKKIKRDRTTTDNERIQQQNQLRSQCFLSFAWIVYPILMKIYDEKTTNTE